MSITKQVTVWCDGQYNSMACAKWEQYSGTAASVRKDLRKLGWTFKAGKDLCKSCSGAAMVTAKLEAIANLGKK